MSWRRRVRDGRVAVCLTTAAALSCLLLLAPPAGAADGVELAVSIDGRPVGESSEREPVRLHPTRPATIDVQVTNSTDRTVTVRTLRLEGRVMALTFFAYDTAVGIPVGPGATETRQYILDLVGIEGQATGLIRGSVVLLDPGRQELASRRVVIDVRGSLWSVYGVFGLTVAGLTGVGLVTAFVAMARHQLPVNRWRRGIRFLTPGLGLGLLVVFTLSAFRVFVPQPGRWIPIMLLSGGAFFLVGYLTPNPDDNDEDDENEVFDPSPDQVRHGEQPTTRP